VHELTDAERARYDRDGYLVRESVFSPDEVAAMIEASEALVAGLVEGRRHRRFTVGSYTFEADLLEGVMLKWEGDSDALHGIEPFAHLSPELEAWGLDPRFTEPMQHLVGHDEPILFTEKLNLKRAHHGGPNPLHQDRPYWDEAPDPDHTATAIVYLDATTLDNGCLEVVPGSHTVGRHPTRQDSDPFGNLEMDPEANAHMERVPVPVPAGSVVLFGAYLAHATGPNRTDRDRRALLYSYQPAGLEHSLEALKRMAGRS
jgi:ectoine hydroxylase-related dioxygenase (phytanoyl-CoA dioxygenase family)